MQAILQGIGKWPAALTYAGDFTGDQWLTLDDIKLFKDAMALGKSSAFSLAHPGARYLAGDFDGNGIVNARDIAGFEGALEHAGVPGALISQVPEPQRLALFLAGSLVLIFVMRRKADAKS